MPPKLKSLVLWVALVVLIISQVLADISFWKLLSQRIVFSPYQAPASSKESAPSALGEFATLERLSVSLKAIEVKLDQSIQQMKALENRQSTAAPRAPIATVPEDLATQVNNLLNEISQATQWPKEAAALEMFAQHVKELAEYPLEHVDKETRENLRGLAWSVTALEIVQNLPEEVSAQNDWLPQATELLEQAPGKAPEAVVVRLRDCMTQRAKASISAVLEGQPTDEALQAAVAADQWLGNQPERNTDTKLQELHAHFLAVQARVGAVKEASVIRSQWLRLKSVRPSDPSFFAYNVSRLLSQINNVRGTLLELGTQSNSFDELRNEIESEFQAEVKKQGAENEKRHADLVRNYQKWSLAKINSFEAAFKETVAESAKNTRYVKLDFGWTKARYEEVKDAMIAHLLPIDPRLLSPAVLRRYEQAYGTGWKALDKMDQQNDVAVADATVERKTLESVNED